MTDYAELTRTLHRQAVEDRAAAPFDSPDAGVPLRIAYFAPAGDMTMIVAPEGLSPVSPICGWSI